LLLLVPQARPFREFAVVLPEHRYRLSAVAGYNRFLENSTRNAPLGVVARSAKHLTREFARIARFLEKPTHKCSTQRQCSFRKSSVLQEPRHVPVLQLAQNPRKNAPFGVVARSAKRSFRNFLRFAKKAARARRRFSCREFARIACS